MNPAQFLGGVEKKFMPLVFRRKESISRVEKADKISIIANSLK